MQKTLSIARNTFRESVRSRILYSIMFFAGLLVAVSALFGSVTIGDQAVVIKDFGLMSISLFSVAFAVISGAALLHKELSRKTIYNILAKPVARGEFIAGKYLGLAATTVVMVALMGSGLSLFSLLFEGSFDWHLVQAYLYILLELGIVCAAAIFFSAVVVTPLLSGLFTFSIFLAGRSVGHLQYFISEGAPGALSERAVRALSLLLPRLDILNVGNDLVYKASITMDHFVWSFVYALTYSGVLLILGTAVFNRREFN